MQHGPGPPFREQDPAERIDALARDAIAEVVSLARPVPNICRLPRQNDNFPAKPLEGYDPAQLAFQTIASTLAAFFAA